MARMEFGSGVVRQVWAPLVALLLAAGCGGGGDALVAQGSAFTRGTITGFGSVIVNGVRFDDSAAQVSDDEDQAHSRDQLKLGMSVEIDSSRVRAAAAGSTTGSADARHIRFGSEIIGPAADINAGAGTFTVLSQKINVTDTTVFDDSLKGGLGLLAAGTVVEVHAQFDAATGQYRATRIEAEPGAPFFKLRGVVSALSNTNHTFKIGEATIDFTNVAAADLPPNFDNGMTVRVRLKTKQLTGDAWEAVTIRNGVRKVEDHDEAEVEGAITDFTSATQFSVNGMKVDATNATFPDGTTGLQKGARVEVKGAVKDGVLIATKVELEEMHRNDDRHRNELHGLVQGLDVALQTFTVHGVKVHYSVDGPAATVFLGGVVGDLATTKKPVEVKGKLGSDGVTVEALIIRFES